MEVIQYTSVSAPYYSEEFTPDPPTPVMEEVKTEVKDEPSSFHTPSVSIPDTSISSGFLCSLKVSNLLTCGILVPVEGVFNKYLLTQGSGGSTNWFSS